MQKGRNAPTPPWPPRQRLRGVALDAPVRPPTVLKIFEVHDAPVRPPTVPKIMPQTSLHVISALILYEPCPLALLEYVTCKKIYPKLPRDLLNHELLQATVQKAPRLYETPKKGCMPFTFMHKCLPRPLRLTLPYLDAFFSLAEVKLEQNVDPG